MSLGLMEPVEAAMMRHPMRQALAAQAAVGMPELGWTVCEALFMPMLLTLEIPQTLLTICWLCSPVVGFCLQPLIGRLSDKYGRRLFIIVFGLSAALGLVLIPLCTRLPREFAIPAAITAFGMTDVSHDVLLTPSRAAMNDAFETEASEQRCAVISGIAKLFSLTIASLLAGDVAFGVVAFVMSCLVVVQFVAPNVLPETDGEEHSAIDQGTVPVGFWLAWLLQTTGWLSTCVYSFYVTSVWAQCVGTIPGTSAFNDAIRFASLLLLAQAVVFIGAGFVLPRFVRFCGGELIALAIALLMYAVSLASFSVSFMYIGSQWILRTSATFMVLAVPMAYQVITNAPFAWLERQPNFNGSERGRLTGWMNASLAVAQCTVAVGSGPLVQAASGNLAITFLVTAVVNIVVVLMAGVWALLLRRTFTLRNAECNSA